MSDRDVDERNENDDDHRVINDGEDDNGDTRQDNGDDNDNGVEHGSIHVSNLSFMTDKDSLRACFEKYGVVTDTIVVKDPQTGTSRGFGFVHFEDARAADDAVTAMNGNELDGRIVRVERSKLASGYQKTPGQYLGKRKPYQSSRGGYGRGYNDRHKYDDRDRRGGGYNSRYDDRPRHDRPRDYDRRDRDRSRDRFDSRRDNYRDDYRRHEDRGRGYDDRRGRY